jgi:hypothetical protein
MKFRPVHIAFGAMAMLFAFAVHAETAAPQPAATHGACALLKPEDLTKLLGSAPSYISKKGACTWSVSGSPKKLITTKFPEEGMAAEMAYYNAEKNASKGGPVVTLKGLGDRGFARLNKIGVVMITIKNGKLLQLIYAPGAAGTEKDIDALKPVALKAIATF